MNAPWRPAPIRSPRLVRIGRKTAQIGNDRGKVDRQQLSGVLHNIDAIFDAETSLWRAAALSEADDEVDEARERLT